MKDCFVLSSRPCLADIIFLLAVHMVCLMVSNKTFKVIQIHYLNIYSFDISPIQSTNIAFAYTFQVKFWLLSPFCLWRGNHSVVFSCISNNATSLCYYELRCEVRANFIENTLNWTDVTTSLHRISYFKEVVLQKWLSLIFLSLNRKKTVFCYAKWMWKICIEWEHKTFYILWKYQHIWSLHDYQKYWLMSLKNCFLEWVSSYFKMKRLNEREIYALGRECFWMIFSKERSTCRCSSSRCASCIANILQQ